MSTVQPPASTAEALGMLRAALGHLASVDPAALTVEEQARCLRVLEESNAVAVAARTLVLGAFAAARGYAEDGDCGLRAWLMHHTGITQGAAASHIAWTKRTPAHPEIARAMAAGELSESAARTLCGWIDKMPEECRGKAGEVLVAAALSGLGLPDLAALAGEIMDRARPRGLPDGDGEGTRVRDEAFEDREVRLETTFQGAGVLRGDLTPECAALVGAVLDALSVPAGPEDTRTQAQRCHDGLEEAMRRWPPVTCSPTGPARR